jgi:hypothetical protein
MASATYVSCPPLPSPRYDCTTLIPL